MGKGTTGIDGTTEQQKLFVYAYFTNKGNGAAAAISAGYSANTAAQTASRLLTYVNVQEMIKELQAELKERAIVTKEEIARELYKIGFSDIRKLYNDDGSLLDIKSIPDEAAACLSSIEVDEIMEPNISGQGKVKVGETKKVKLWDKLKALAALSEMYGYNAPTKIAQTDSEGKDVPFQLIFQPAVKKDGQ